MRFSAVLWRLCEICFRIKTKDVNEPIVFGSQSIPTVACGEAAVHAILDKDTYGRHKLIVVERNQIVEQQKTHHDAGFNEAYAAAPSENQQNDRIEEIDDAIPSYGPPIQLNWLQMQMEITVKIPIGIIYQLLTLFMAKAARPATPSVLNISEPMMVPKPMSDSSISVDIVFVKNSGIDVAVAINVAAATSFDRLRSSQMHSTVGRK